MINWSLCFGFVVRHHIRADACSGEKPLISWLESEKKKKRSVSYNFFQWCVTSDLKTSYFYQSTWGPFALVGWKS
jgi:hypothetical protein